VKKGKNENKHKTEMANKEGKSSKKKIKKQYYERDNKIS